MATPPLLGNLHLTTYTQLGTLKVFRLCSRRQIGGERSPAYIYSIHPTQTGQAGLGFQGFGSWSVRGRRVLSEAHKMRLKKTGFDLFPYRPKHNSETCPKIVVICLDGNFIFRVLGGHQRERRIQPFLEFSRVDKHTTHTLRR